MAAARNVSGLGPLAYFIGWSWFETLTVAAAANGGGSGDYGQTDRQTDRRTDRVRRNMRPPPREESRIIRICLLFCIHHMQCLQSTLFYTQQPNVALVKLYLGTWEGNVLGTVQTMTILQFRLSYS